MQMMIIWHIDDLMISHLKQSNVMEVVLQIKDIYKEAFKGGKCNGA
jgi:hypothetical protein